MSQKNYYNPPFRLKILVLGLLLSAGALTKNHMMKPALQALLPAKQHLAPQAKGAQPAAPHQAVYQAGLAR
jgi:hypothetical protein